MSSSWPSLPPYEAWHSTCDTLHAHTQVLGKLAATFASPEPQLQHACVACNWDPALAASAAGTTPPVV
jgi:hypothetical protein